MKLADVFGDRVLGSVSGLDRVRFRGTVRWLSSMRGLRSFVASTGLILKDFGAWAEGMTRQLRASCAQRARELGIATVYLRKGGVDKEHFAREIALRDGIVDGSICMLSAVEPCFSVIVAENRAERKLELDMGRRQCLWIYHYLDDPEVGFGHVRLQTWLSFTALINIRTGARIRRAAPRPVRPSMAKPLTTPDRTPPRPETPIFTACSPLPCRRRESRRCRRAWTAA